MNDGSKEFLKFVRAEMKDGYKYHERFRKARALLLEWEQMPPTKVTKMLMDKLKISAEEYGDPRENKGKYDIQKEIGYEVLDMVFGWPQVDDWTK